MMILVSGSTRTVADLAPRWPGRLGILLTPAGWRPVAKVIATGLPWGIDNGAYSGFDPSAFRRLVARAAGQPRLLWVVCPDVVADARATLDLFQEWGPELRDAGVPVALALQDGQERLSLPDADCYFVGGTTRFKLSQAAADLVAEGKRRGAWAHMGRVNSVRRLETALSFGCDSVDGTAVSMYGDAHLESFLLGVRALRRRERDCPAQLYGD